MLTVAGVFRGKPERRSGCGGEVLRCARKLALCPVACGGGEILTRLVTKVVDGEHPFSIMLVSQLPETELGEWPSLPAQLLGAGYDASSRKGAMQTMDLPEFSGDAAWVFDMQGDPDPYIVTIGFATAADSDAEAFIAGMVDTWLDNIRALHSEDITLRETKCVWNDGGTLRAFEHAAGVPGQNSSSVLPQNCALLVRKNTGLAGRKFRGRMYWPSMLSESLVDNIGQIASGTVTTLQGVFDAVFSDLDGLSNSEVRLLHANGDESTPVTSFSVQPVLATQRRRLR
jgi:hypothetical protein